ncbi:hypothetical protein MNBD_GAMMA13-834 [hydrothermal vent metagenome]|uniref:histidine kinase n=1 Tax=hydrothermal vent metagenome TaxID=652676 RepID=A0A3B0Z6A2_9ZZZZ
MTSPTVYLDSVEHAFNTLNQPHTLKSGNENTHSFHFPYTVLGLTLLICLLPLLNLWGFSLASEAGHFDIQQLALQNLSTTHLTDEMFYALRGNIHHALLEWSAIIIAVVCVGIAFAHYSISHDIIAPVLGLTLVMSGSMDAVHTLAATRMVDAIAENNTLIPFTWAVSRSFNAIALLLGVALVLFKKSQHNNTLHTASLLALALLLSSAVYVLASWMAVSENLPQTQFSSNFISRPYDILPMGIFLVCLPLFIRLYQDNRNYLTAAIVVSLFPNIFSEAYMAFGSKHLFDHYFNSAHGLKVLGYALPLMGYILDYQTIFTRQEKQKAQLLVLNKSLKESEHRFRTMNQLLPVGLLLANSKGIIVSINQYAKDLFGYTKDDLIGHKMEELVPKITGISHTAVHKNYKQNNNPYLLDNVTDFFTGHHCDGSEIALDIGLAHIRLDDQDHSLVSLLNISQLKRLMDELKFQNERMDQAMLKLTESNEQLERFAFVCSHDLQEPVRMVQSFSQLIERRLKNRLDEKDKEYLHYVIDGAHRAQEMIRDILLFSRLDKPVNSREPVCLNELCKNVRDALQETLETKEAKFIWTDNLPTLNAIPSQLFQLILNLVSNGLKFNRDKTPTVLLDAVENPQGWSIEIRDNGIGINPSHQHKIFQIFERLNAKSEFPGTGIGLAICKKIAAQHHAELTLESSEGEGTTFFIRWPEENIISVPLSMANQS